MPPTNSRSESGRPLAELALLFLRLGATAFGGPAAHIAMMEDEVVRRRHWLTRDEFMDLLGAINLIPGPNSTEMAIHIGHRRAGFPGLVVAGACFILPAMVIVMALAALYVSAGKLPQVASVLFGVKPVIIAVVAQAMVGLTRSAVKTRLLAGVGVAGVVLAFLQVHELLLLLASGVAVVLVRLGTRAASSGNSLQGWLGPVLGGAVLKAAPAVGAAVGLDRIFLFFLKVGSVLFGSGYVLLAFLRADLVERWHWLTGGQLLDAIAVGQVTPGPVFTTATFIGYLLAGVRGGLVATLGIFLPAFFFVAVSGPLVPRLRRSAVASAFLDGVNVASLALMVTVTWQLGRTAIVDVWTVLLAALSAVLLIRFRVNSAWLVLGGGLVGLFVRGG